MSKSILYASNSTTQNVVSTGTIVNFGSINRRYGQNITLGGGNVYLQGQGYYDIDTNLTFNYTGTEPGTLTIQILQNGVAIPGAVSTINVTASTTYAVTLPTMVRTYCCQPTTISVNISGATGTITNASVIVEKE